MKIFLCDINQHGRLFTTEVSSSQNPADKIFIANILIFELVTPFQTHERFTWQMKKKKKQPFIN